MDHRKLLGAFVAAALLLAAVSAGCVGAGRSQDGTRKTAAGGDAVAGAGQAPRAEKKTAWGRAAGNLQAGMAERSVHHSGQFLAFAIHIRNSGTDKLQVPGDIRTKGRWELVLQPAAGKALRFPRAEQVDAARPPDPVQLDTGQEARAAYLAIYARSVEEEHVGAWELEALPPGKYVATASYASGNEGPWKKISTGSLEVEVAKQVKIEREWWGHVEDETLDTIALPGGRGLTFIADKEGFVKLWRAWRKDEPVPAVDFGRELVLAATASEGNGVVFSLLSVDAAGNLNTMCQRTMVLGKGFGYRIAVVRREGIKSVMGVAIEPGPKANR